MIRRSIPLSDKPDKWLLISQVEHARISAELAATWGNDDVQPVVCAPESANPHLLEVRRELLLAIDHHDDGWAAWEASPALDAEQGRPYSFLDLPRERALPLWRDSVVRCRQIGPLAGWVVAGHFSRLLADSDNARCEASRDWQLEMDTCRTEWLAEWRSINRPVHRPTLANECLGWLRLFDWLSLWFCCYCPTGAGEATCDSTTLDEGSMAATPVTFQSDAATERGRQVTASPWPFNCDRLELDALGYAVPAHFYNSEQHLAKSRSPMRLGWHLKRAD